MKKLLNLIFLSLIYLQAFSQAKYDNEYLIELMQSQHYKEAASYLGSFYPEGANEPKIISRIAYCYLMSGNLVEAEKSYKILLAKDSTSKSTLFSLAAINDKRGNLLQSKFYYQKILTLDSTNFSVYKQLAHLAERNNDKDLHKAYLERANSLSATDADVAYDLSNVYKQSKELKKADSIIDLALKADTLNLTLILGKMEIAHQLKNHPVAFTMSKKAVDMGESSAQTLNILGQSCYFLKYYQDCIKVYSLLHQGGLGNQTTFYYTAMAYKKLNNIEKCVEFLDKSIEDCISPNVVFYLEELALNHETLKNYNSSIEAFQKAAFFEMKNEYNYSIARLYDGYLKNSKKALKYYKLFLAGYKAESKQTIIYGYAVNRTKELAKRIN